MVDTDFFPNICQLLILEANSTFGSTEAERAASGIRRLKTLYQSTVGDKRESDLNLLHLQRISNIDIQSVAQMFIRKHLHKNVSGICFVRRLTVVESKRTNVCYILNI